MNDMLPTVWEAEPHTLVKHKILQRYLKAWLPILTQQASNLKQQGRQILFIDGFAGPGEYKGGEPGSPVIALKTALDHSVQFPVPVQMLFIELDDKRFKHLQDVLAPHITAANTSDNIHAAEPIHGDCDTVLTKMLADFRKGNVKFGPALAFLDQFGYGAVSMELLTQILAFPQCEVFTYLGYKDMNRWITDPKKAAAFTRAFGGEEWQQCIDLPEKERRNKLLELYKSALKQPQRAGAKYVVSFLMFDKHDCPLYWLLFCTNSLRGLEEMKKAMWSVDSTGEFRFSDSDSPDQLSLLSVAFDQPWLADELCRRLGGRTMSIDEVFEFVLTETPCYLFKTALKILETDRRMKIVSKPPTRRPKTYPKDHWAAMKVSFAKSMF
jgi:three-Cys-motif partner protein